MLLFDIGNSRCKWAWIEAGMWQRQGVFANADESAWQQLKLTFSSLPAPQIILLSNVAGAVLTQRVREACALWSCPLELVVAQTAQCGVRNGYVIPAQLGSDRWAALIAAWHRVKGACLVVNCGTATTVDALSETGEFLGGLILPGLELMQRSLLNNTAQLTTQTGEVRDFPRSTADAMESGATWASIGAIRHQFLLLQSQHTPRCLISGGAANKLLPYFEMPVEQVEDLVLQGLQIIGQEYQAMKRKEMVK